MSMNKINKLTKSEIDDLSIGLKNLSEIEKNLS